MSGEAMDAAARALCAEMTGPCECASPPGEPACTGPKIMARAAIVGFLRHWEPTPAVMAATFATGSPANIVVAAARAEADALERAAAPEPKACARGTT